MYSNYRKCHFGQLRTWCVFPALLILAGCALVATLLLPPCTASASPQTASLPAVYQLLLGNDEAPPVPPNTTLSHPIPLTYYVTRTTTTISGRPASSRWMTATGSPMSSIRLQMLTDVFFLPKPIGKAGP